MDMGNSDLMISEAIYLLARARHNVRTFYRKIVLILRHSGSILAFFAEKAYELCFESWLSLRYC